MSAHAWVTERNQSVVRSAESIPSDGLIFVFIFFSGKPPCPPPNCFHWPSEKFSNSSIFCQGKHLKKQQLQTSKDDWSQDFYSGSLPGKGCMECWMPFSTVKIWSLILHLQCLMLVSEFSPGFIDATGVVFEPAAESLCFLLTAWSTNVGFFCWLHCVAATCLDSGPKHSFVWKSLCQTLDPLSCWELHTGGSSFDLFQKSHGVNLKGGFQKSMGFAWRAISLSKKREVILMTNVHYLMEFCSNINVVMIIVQVLFVRNSKGDHQRLRAGLVSGGLDVGQNAPQWTTANPQRSRSNMETKSLTKPNSHKHLRSSFWKNAT